MSYTVLARKYRSQSFDEVIGQEPIAQTLKNAIKTGRVAHAYLFSGTRGVGKTTMARILAKALNCLNSDAPTSEPCCKCNSCIAINAGEDIDVIEIDGASNRGIDNIRELRQNAIYRPARARFKIYIIDEVHMLTTESFNALLKILEEPPDHVKFIFATTEPNKVIATIQSRCQRFNFTNINLHQIADHLKSLLNQEKIKYEDDLILPLAKAANGSMRDGLSLLDRLISVGIEPLTAKLLEEFLGCPDSEKVYNLIDNIGDSDGAAALSAADTLINAGLDEVQIVNSLIDCMRDLMIIKSAGKNSELLILTDQQRKQAAQLAEKFDIAALVYNITALEKLRWTIKNSDTRRALIEACILRFALSEHFLNVDTLVAGGNVKKKPTLNKPAVQTIAQTDKPEPEKQTELLSLPDLQAIKDNWQAIMKLIGDRLGNSTRGLLNSAQPTRLENDLLTITFDASAQMSKKMCDSNGRIKAIEDVLNQSSATSIRIQLDINTEDHKTDVPATEHLTTSQRRNELVNDPAVKTVLLGLDATITGIEEAATNDGS